MKKYALKTNEGYVKQFFNNYGGTNDYHCVVNIFDATMFDRIEEAKEGIDYCKQVDKADIEMSKAFGFEVKQNNNKINIIEIEIIEREINQSV